eukprot:TRINITY_DN1654_c0_g1_i1.p1 TRINITY_DN1654_c0_g1~~TRINITY_DN1654_c0_g1_i1.p1  ORF type:complete len:435 (-),score=103.94 TRINITY_DN1654_c0_g1_i1:26-1330(-)
MKGLMGYRLVVCLVIILVLVNEGFTQNFCPTAPSFVQDRRSDKSQVVVSTFNTEWSFLSRSNCPGNGCPWKDITQARIHLSHIADKIALVNADIYVLEEVENCVVLRELLSLPQLATKGYKPYMVQGTDTATGQNVGILTRIDPSTNVSRTTARASWPIAGNTCKSNKNNEGTSGVSKHLYTTFHIPGLDRPLLLVGLHLLAFPTTAERCIEREAQATVIREIIDQHPNHHVIVLGDFNDYDKDLVDESKVSIPTSRVIPIIKGSELVNAALTHPGAKTGLGVYSSWWDKNNNCKDDAGAEHTVIDHILVSKSLSFNSFRYEHIFKAGCESNVSDHWPVAVNIRTRSSLAKGPTTPEQEIPVTETDADGEVVGVLSHPSLPVYDEPSSNVHTSSVVFTVLAGLGFSSCLLIVVALWISKRRPSTAQENQPIISV